MTIEEFKEQILHSIFGGKEDIPEYKLTDKDWEVIRKISDERYKSWDWNFGKSPSSNYSKSIRFEGIGTIEVRLNIEKASITEAKIYGDFFGAGDVQEIEDVLCGVAFTKSSILEALKKKDLAHYFGKISQEEFLSLFI